MGLRPPAAGPLSFALRLLIVDCWLMAGGCLLMAASCLLLATCSRLKARGSRLEAGGSRLKAQGSRLKAQSGAILDGERDYSKQTLATLAFRRMSVFRGVVNMVLVSVTVQCVNMRFFCETRKSRSYPHQDHMCAQQLKLRCCTSMFLLRARIEFHKINSLASTEQ